MWPEGPQGYAIDSDVQKQLVQKTTCNPTINSTLADICPTVHYINVALTLNQYHSMRLPLWEEIGC